MSRPIIDVESVSKCYRLQHQASERYTTLRDTLTKSARGLLRGRGTAKTAHEDFWALRDVSFSLEEGEVLGVIGRNGAGKSTLLKVLSRITEPTKGRITLRGRVASLLEVGTGFHPELTGRENIFLNGAILGMTKEEIRKKFDEIVDFAEVERFLDTPVKRYSSGMYVRLAFAVAAHLEPEILVIDEVLAVGDAQFQSKCLRRMGEAAKGGRTVLFVSHNMSAVQSLCSKALFLEQGRVREMGPMQEVLRSYMASIQAGGNGPDAGGVRLGAGLTLTSLDVAPGGVVSGEDTTFRVEMLVHEPQLLKEAALLITTDLGVRVAILDLRESGIHLLHVEKGPLVIEGTVQRMPLTEGDYRVGLWIATDRAYGNHMDLAAFHVTEPPVARDYIPFPASNRGSVRMEFEAVVNQQQQGDEAEFKAPGNHS